uniref:NADH-ubiquinone oxidoreductase chain 2 n=1 Tax=Chamberlainia hainesiana TaxID=1264661 RepID=A0A513X0B4_9BIVA|nr:NADH dehydrogenase subunit 2 [Chamberlainia hainesiana]
MSPKMHLLVPVLISSSLLTIMSNNILMVWMMLELNSLTFIPLIQTNKSTSEVEASINYLTPQTFASGVLMASIMLAPLIQDYSKMLASTALLMKLGAAPLHAWFPSVMQSIGLAQGFILMTWQKLAPLMLLSVNQLSHTHAITMSATISAIWGSIAGLNQTNLLMLMTFSSITHLSWPLMALLMNPQISLLYLICYTLTILPIFMYLSSPISLTHHMITTLTTNKYSNISVIIHLLSLGGLPPLAMFSAKLPIITIMSTSMAPILAILLVGTGISLYFYLIIIITISLNTFKTPKTDITLSTTWQMCFILLQLFIFSLTLWFIF